MTAELGTPKAENIFAGDQTAEVGLAESEMNCIATVGARSRAFPKIRTRRRGLHLPNKNPDWERITPFDWLIFLCHDWPVNCRKLTRDLKQRLRGLQAILIWGA